MSKYIKDNVNTKCSTSGWDQMITDARERIKKLELSIKVFTQKKESGEPWPGTTKQAETLATRN